jgi:hypothetical protein
MGLDEIDRQAMAEGQALSDVRDVRGSKLQRNHIRPRYRTKYADDLKSDKSWAKLVRKVAMEEV